MRNSYVAIVRGVHATTKAIQPLHITSTFDHQRRGAKNDGIAEDKLCTEKIIYNQREEKNATSCIIEMCRIEEAKFG
jgi:hypothetical protein